MHTLVMITTLVTLFEGSVFFHFWSSQSFIFVVRPNHFSLSLCASVPHGLLCGYWYLVMVPDLFSTRSVPDISVNVGSPKGNWLLPTTCIWNVTHSWSHANKKATKFNSVRKLPNDDRKGKLNYYMYGWWSTEIARWLLLEKIDDRPEFPL